MGQRKRLYILPQPVPAGAGGDPAVGGDLAGVASGASVIGLRGVPLSGVPLVSGQTYVFDSISGQLVPAYLARYFATGAAAQAAAPHIVGTFVIIYPGATPTEAGTYEVTANGGAAFPADYTKVSDHTDTAAEVGVIDADGNFVPTDVEEVLAALATGLVVPKTGALLITNNVIDFFQVASYKAAKYIVTLSNGTQRYQSTIDVASDGTTCTVTESDVEVGPGVTTVPVSFDADVASGNVRLLAIASQVGWSYSVRRLALHP